MKPPWTRLEPVAAALLVLCGTALVVSHAAGDAATVDEPVHVTAGVEIARQGTARWNPEHPPLAKALAGLALSGLPLAPVPDPIADPRHGPLLARFLFENATPGETILRRARLPFALLFAGLLLAARAIARNRFGPAAGLLALAFCAFEPNLIAHAGVVHTDVAVTLFVVLALLPLARLPRPEARGAAWLLGLLWGLAFLSKYDAPLLALATLPLLLADPEARRPWRRLLARLSLAAGIALLVTLAGFALAARHQKAADREALARDRLELRGGSPAAARAAIAVGSVLPPAGNLLTGVLSVVLQGRGNAPPNAFAGRVYTGAIPFYLPVALATKTSLSLLLALLAGAASRPGRRLAAACGAGILFFLLVSAPASYNIGVRHVLFFFPLTALVAASAAVSETRALRAAAIVLAGTQALETLAVHPFEMSFFNVAAGGLRGGHQLFADSNVDWGQDLARLAREAPRWGAPLPAVVFGGDLPRRYAPSLRALAPGDEDRPGAVIAIGEAALALGPEHLAFRGATRDAERLERLRAALRSRGERIGAVGGSIAVFRIRASAPSAAE